MSAVIEMRDVHAGYGHVDVLRGLSFALTEGSVTAVLGPTGAGKTTTARTIAGLIQPSGGRVLVCGHDVTGAPPDALARAGLCVIPEGRGIFPRLTVDEHLTLVARHRRELTRVRERVYTHFPVLKERRGQLAGTLSGGEQRMLALARAVTGNPAAVVIDELSLGLARPVVQHLYEYVRSLAATGISVIIIEQLAHDLLEVADHALVMRGGRVIRAGPPESLTPHLTDLFFATSPTGDDHDGQRRDAIGPSS
jgi:branched-chain amino acid transport system ATP-binding protein